MTHVNEAPEVIMFVRHGEKPGEGTTVVWPTGIGGKGNEGVAAYVQKLPNAIGYVEYAYVKQNKLNYVLMQNADGAFVAPDDTAFKAAAAGAPKAPEMT